MSERRDQRRSDATSSYGWRAGVRGRPSRGRAGSELSLCPDITGMRAGSGVKPKTPSRTSGDLGDQKHSILHGAVTASTSPIGMFSPNSLANSITRTPAALAYLAHV